MDRPTQFIMENVRCFDGEHCAHLRPITLLVGENSTGKTTFLGCYGVLHRLLSWENFPDNEPDFNREPFSMGSFRDMARSRQGSGGRVGEFSLGIRVEPGKKKNLRPYLLRVTFSAENSQPVVSSVRYEFDAGSFIELRRSGDGGTILAIPNVEATTCLPFDQWAMVLDFLSDGERDLFFGGQSADVKSVADYVSALTSSRKKGRQYRVLMPNLLQLIPIAPLRSKPKRTYDPVRESASPDGEHIPMLMMRLARTDKGSWGELHNDLADFGRASGLFSDIRVKRHGRQMSDPFQLQVNVRSGARANIMDVGYGVSQSLPILVDVRVRKDCMFLLQQPEVHLHPRAQAELAGLFVESFKRQGNRFLIETHSEHIVDRVRILVRKRVLPADDVSILYFEPKGDAVTIHNVTLDREGNFDDVPLGYRDFFLKESDRLLGFAD